MLPSQSKSGLSETSTNKPRPATPRASKLPRAASTKSGSNSPSTLQRSRTAVDRSPRSVDSKPVIERRSPKITTTPDKQARGLKGPELQQQLNAAQEELKKAAELLASAEIEKSQVLEELQNAKRLADETNEKLQEALAVKKKAEESSEIVKFRADEMEQAGIEAAQKREEEWQKELDSIQSQHSTDVAALVSATEAMQRVKHELMVASDAKNAALSHADDAMKIAEINAEKAEILSVEVNRLKALLDSKLNSMNDEAAEIVKKMEADVDALKHELARAKVAECQLAEMEALAEVLRTELSNAKRAEMDASKLVDEWKKKVESLEVQVEEADCARKSSSDSLAAAMKEMEENNASLQEAELKIATLKEDVESLEIEVDRKRDNVEESDRHLETAKQEVLEMERQLENLKSELQAMEDAKMQALNNEKIAILNIESLVEEKDMLMIELEVTRDEGEKVKKAMEDLASSLHEVSDEARDMQERLLVRQAEADDASAEIEKLKLALINTEENYELMLDEAKYEIVCLQKATERIQMEAKKSRDEWDAKELDFVNLIKKSEEEIAALKVEIEKVVNKLKGAEEESKVVKEEEDELVNKSRQAEIEASMANESVEQVKAENLKVKEMLLDKENELQNITQENDDLRIREAAALEKIKELSALLEEAKAKKAKESGKLSPKAIELPEEIADETVTEKPQPKIPFGNGSDVNENGNRIDEESVKEEVKEPSSEKEQDSESVDDELDSKVDDGSFDQINGLLLENVDNGSVSPTRQKKKKALLGRFGSLLKKKSNHK